MKIPYLEAKEIVDSVSLAVGEQTNVHHCKTGKNNDRCYVKRITHGYILYCHHCCQHAYVADSFLSARPITDKATSTGGKPGSNLRPSSVPVLLECDESGEADEGGHESAPGYAPLYLPSDASNSIARWESSEPKLWLISHGITVDSLKDYPIYWSNRRQSLLFPIYSNGELVGYQQRRFPADPSIPKYISVYKSDWRKADGVIDWIEPIVQSDTVSVDSESKLSLVLCEDYVSAVRCALCGYFSIPLYGTGINTQTVVHLSKRFTTFFVALDNDNSIVRRQARRLTNQLSLYGNARNLNLTKDPKKYSHKELQEVLDAARCN